jgi:hypothetical protein
MISAIPAVLGVPSRGGRRLVAEPALPAFVALSRTQTSTRATAIGTDDATWAEFAADLPRYQGSARRLLVEGTRSNRVRNPRAEGAVAGTPGTMPTNWGNSLVAGISQQVIGLASVNGVTGLRVRFFGTPSATGSVLTFVEAANSVAAANGQAWTSAAFLSVSIASGGTPGVRLANREMAADGTTLVSGDTAAPLLGVTTSLARFARSATIANATTAFITPTLRLDLTAATAYDFTVTIGWPQIEQATFASTPMLPLAGTPAVSTRNADLLTATLSALGIGANGACTVLVWAVLPQAAPASVDQTLVSIDDGTVNNRYRIFNTAGGSTINVGRSVAGAGLTSTAGSMTPGTPFKAGMSVDSAGRVTGSFNGGAVVAQTGGPTTGLTTFRIGNNAGNTGPLCGLAAECRVLPYAVPDGVLPGLVAALPG